jgi:uncharacterized protein (DUF2236 family)
MIRIPIPLDFGAVLERSFPFLMPRPAPLRDPTPDPGLFGPESVTWKVMREPLLILGGGRALLMQAAHPLVAEGAIEHSTYATDPYGRLDRTVLWVTMCAFGTTAEAREACREVNRLHRRVRGRLPGASATSAIPAGSAYSGQDPGLLRWVHATFVDTMLTCHDAYVGGLSEAERDRFVREWHRVARLMGVPRPLLWRSHADLVAYVEEEIRSGRVRPGAGSRRVSRTILAPPLPNPALTPLWQMMVFTMIGLVPAEIREGYGVRWTAAHTAAHRAVCLWLRRAGRTVPRRLRASPAYDRAMLRVQGRWPVDAAA